ncbi:DUF4249 domain-containing protein [Chitinophaga solisilvae]|uniref:DUF4249 domain-containing protein n=1 Tax=Chitinophaga solisilvae TaxID=1233460 RepID=UPI0013682F12|nr:DUF4249 domain-containing protein [Chitinophaga solisilvae]
MKIKLLLLLALTAAGCTKKIDVNFPDQTSKPVLNLLMVKDSLMEARVTLSGYMNKSNDFPAVENAVVKLYEDGIFREEMTRLTKDEKVVYISTVKVRTGVTYRVTAAIPGYPEAEGSDVVPEPANAGEIKLKLIPTNGFYPKANITVELHDRAGEKNYYRIRLLNAYKFDSNEGPREYRYAFKFTSGDPRDVIFGTKDRYEFFTDDAYFDGQRAKFIFVSGATGDFRRVMVEVTTLTYNSYNYLFSAFMAHEKNDDPLAEKVIVFNNIVHGLGVVGGATKQEYIVTP